MLYGTGMLCVSFLSKAERCHRGGVLLVLIIALLALLMSQYLEQSGSRDYTKANLFLQVVLLTCPVTVLDSDVSF